jgi:uncharacterized protein YjbJ (UPF0337 family)
MEGKEMNKDYVKGTIDDAAGRAKRQVAEWTGDTHAQLEGLGQQVKGKAEKAWGTAKDAVQEGHQQLKEQAGKAWGKSKDAVQDGKEQVKSKTTSAWDSSKDASKDAARNAKVETHRRQQAERRREEDDLEPVEGAGKGTGKIVTPTH